ncbi:MAG: amino acid ABC transporter substrate-binding protein [Nitrospinota bacterium]
MKRWQRLWAAAILALVLAGPAPVLAANEIVVGGSLSLTGPFSEPANRMSNSYRMYVDELNARGGWLGRKVKLVLLDDKSDNQTAIRLYEKLIVEDKVDLLVGPYASAPTDAVANVVERYKFPMIGVGASSLSIWSKGRKYTFNVIQVAQDYQKGALHLAKEIGLKRIAVISQDTLFPRQAAEGVVAWAKELGLEVVLNENYPTKQTDFSALLQKIKVRRVDAIISNSYFADAAAQLRQMKEQNFNVKMFSSTVGPALPRFPEELGPIAEYVLGYSQWEPLPDILKNPGMAEYIASYQKRFNEVPNYHAGQAYAGLQILETAIKKAGSIDKAKLWETLKGLETTTILGRWKVDDRLMNEHEGLTFQIQNGKRLVVWPPRYAQTKAKLPMPDWDKRPKN